MTESSACRWEPAAPCCGWQRCLQPTVALVGGSCRTARKDGLIEELDQGRLVFTHPLYASAVYEARRRKSGGARTRSWRRCVEDSSGRSTSTWRSPPPTRMSKCTALTPTAPLNAPARACPVGSYGASPSFWNKCWKSCPPATARGRAHSSGRSSAETGRQMDALAERALARGVERCRPEQGARGSCAWAEVAVSRHRVRLAPWPARLEARRTNARASVAGPNPRVVGILRADRGVGNQGLLERAIELRNTADGHGYEWSRRSPAHARIATPVSGRVAEARASILELVEETAADGDEPVLVLVRFGLIHVELLSGRWKARRGRGNSVRSRGADRTGEFGGMANFWKALVAAHLGHEDEARAEAEAGPPGPKLESARFRSDEPRGPRLRRALARPGPRCPSALPPDARLGVGTKGGHCDASASRVRLSDRRLGRRGQTRRGGIRGRAAREGSTKAEESDCTCPRRPLRWPAPSARGDVDASVAALERAAGSARERRLAVRTRAGITFARAPPATGEGEGRREAVARGGARDLRRAPRATLGRPGTGRALPHRATSGGVRTSLPRRNAASPSSQRRD